MNKRRRDLLASERVDNSFERVEYFMYREDVEGLIKLIVQECCDMMIYNQSIDKDPNWNRALRETSKKIKQHYGVE